MQHRFRPRLVSHAEGLTAPFIAGYAHLTLELAGGDPVDVDRTLLRAMRISPAAAFEQAMGWLRAVSGRHELKPVDTVPGMWYASGRVGQVAARLPLLPEWFAEDMPYGGLVAAAPGGQQLLVVPMGHAGALDALRVLAVAVGTAYEHAETPISDQLFWYDGLGWQVLHVHRDDSGRVSVLPTDGFVRRVRELSALDLVRTVAEA